MDPSLLALQPPRYVLSTFVCDRDRSEYTVEYFAYSFLSLLCMVFSGKTVCTDQSSLFFQDTSDGRFCFIIMFFPHYHCGVFQDNKLCITTEIQVDTLFCVLQNIHLRYLYKL